MAAAFCKRDGGRAHPRSRAGQGASTLALLMCDCQGGADGQGPPPLRHLRHRPGARGRRRDVYAVNPTDNLRHLHDRLRSGVALVSQLEELLHGRGDPGDKLATFARVSDYLQDVVVPHLRAERAALYPEATRVAGIDLRLLRRLADNCEELERQVARLLHDHARLRGGVHDNVGCRWHLTTLVRLLRRHLQTVEDELLPCLDRELADEDVYRIYERIEEVSFEEEVAGRVPAGAEAAVAAARRLRDIQGIDAELFFLGEYVSDPQLVERTVAATSEACRLLGSAGLAAHLSIDPTAIGLLTDAGVCLHNAERIARWVACT
jgi:hemerythrin-like domain-containing protein